MAEKPQLSGRKIQIIGVVGAGKVRAPVIEQNNDMLDV